MQNRICLYSHGILLKINKNKIFWGCVVVGLVFRIWLAFALPVWLDETLTLEHIKQPFLSIVKGNLMEEHPFGFYVFIKLWAMVSDNLFWLRIPALVFFLINCWLLRKITKMSQKNYIDNFLVYSYVFSGYFIIFDWQARMYTAVITLVLASWYAYRRNKFLFFVLLNILGLFFDYAFLWYMISLSVFIAYRFYRNKSSDSLFLKGVISSWAVFGLWLPTFLSKFSKALEGIEWNYRYTKLSFVVPYLFGVFKKNWLFIPFVVVVLIGVYYSFNLKHNIDSRFFIFSGIFSGLISYLSTQVIGPIFHVRNLQIVGIAVLFSLTAFFYWLWRKNKIILFVMLLIYFINFVTVVRFHYSSPGSLLLNFPDL